MLMALAFGASGLYFGRHRIDAWVHHRGAGESPGGPGHPLDSPRDLVNSALDSDKLAVDRHWLEQAADARVRANVVLITLESVGANRVGFLGYRDDVTPNLDRIARDSLVYERAYTTATHSNYAQMAILSSLFPRRGNALDMYGRLDYPRFLLHDVTNALGGYRSATISSQDESWQGMLDFETTKTPTLVRHSPDFAGKHLSLISEDIVPDEETAKRAIEFIDSAGSEPFSLYVNFQSTHFPYPIPADAPRLRSPSEPRGRFDFLHWDEADRQAIENRHDDALAYVDAQVGSVFDALDDRDLLGNTIFVVVADHGEMFFEHDLVTHGRSLFEEETRVPLLVHAPDGEAHRITRPVSTLDTVPTIVDELGQGPYPGHQGESVRWAWRDGPFPHPAIFMNIQGWKHLDGVVCLPYKLVRDPEVGSTALYDLDRDPRETTDVASARPAVTHALEEVLGAQIEAQQRYHALTDEGAAFRADRFAPHLLACPPLPAAR